MGVLRIGTSSWAGPGFVEEWYPPGLPARDRLAWYAERFDAVEVNSTFYAVPGAVTVARWAEVTPEHFTFDVKVHRLLSRHSAGLDALPKDLRPNVRTTSRGRVVLDERSRRSGWRSSCATGPGPSGSTRSCAGSESMTSPGSASTPRRPSGTSR